MNNQDNQKLLSKIKVKTEDAEKLKRELRGLWIDLFWRIREQGLNSDERKQMINLEERIKYFDKGLYEEIHRYIRKYKILLSS